VKILKQLKNMSNMLKGSTKYWKEQVDNISSCPCTRSEIIIEELDHSNEITQNEMLIDTEIKSKFKLT
jgi:hypothetical protein